MDKQVRKPTVHSMKRRSSAHDYSRSGFYHITLAFQVCCINRLDA